MPRMRQAADAVNRAQTREYVAAAPTGETDGGSVPVAAHNRRTEDSVERHFWKLVFGVLAIAAAIRFWDIGSECYWLDELHSLMNTACLRGEFEGIPFQTVLPQAPRFTDPRAGCDWRAVWGEMRHEDTHPPLYFLVLHVWRSWWGDREFALRSLSALFSVFSIVPFAWQFRLMGKSRAGLVAAVLMAFAFAHIRMAHETRPYSLAILLGTAGFALLESIVRQDREKSRKVEKSKSQNAGSAVSSFRRFDFSTFRLFLLHLAYGATVCLSLLTHYFTGFILLAQAAYAVIALRRRVWPYLGTLALGCTAAAAAWGPAVLDQLTLIRNQPWLTEQTSDHVWRTVLRATDLPLRLLVQFPIFDDRVIRSVLGVALLAACIVSLRIRRVRAAWPSVFWFGVPAMGLTFLDLFAQKHTLHYVRYFAFAVPGMVGMAALALEPLRPRLLTLVVLGWLALCVRCLDVPVKNPQGRGAAAELAQRMGPRDLLVFDVQGRPADWLYHYYAEVTYYMRDARPPVLLLATAPTGELEESFRSFERLFVVTLRTDDIPNPSRSTHEWTLLSPYFEDIGWIYVFTRKTGEGPTP